LSRVGRLQPGQKFNQAFRVPLEGELASNNDRLIAFVQESHNGKVIGATLQRAIAPK
jgi:hypothetical protein